MLKIVNLLENLLTLVDRTKEDKVVGKDISGEIIKIYLSFKVQKYQNCQRSEFGSKFLQLQYK